MEIDDTVEPHMVKLTSTEALAIGTPTRVTAEAAQRLAEDVILSLSEVKDSLENSGQSAVEIRARLAWLAQKSILCNNIALQFLGDSPEIADISKLKENILAAREARQSRQ